MSAKTFTDRSLAQLSCGRKMRDPRFEDALAVDLPNSATTSRTLRSTARASWTTVPRDSVVLRNVCSLAVGTWAAPSPASDPGPSRQPNRLRRGSYSRKGYDWSKTASSCSASRGQAFGRMSGLRFRAGFLPGRLGLTKSRRNSAGKLTNYGSSSSVSTHSGRGSSSPFHPVAPVAISASVSRQPSSSASMTSWAISTPMKTSS